MGYGIMISFMDIAGFRPLEDENTEEEIEKLFGSAKGEE